MKRIFILILIFLCIKLQALAQVQVSYYVQGDQDDWQLFMFNSIKDDLDVGNNKVVIITLTAGDEGYGSTIFGSGAIAYYLAKEAGAVYSSKFAGDITNPSISPNNTRPLPTAQNVVLNGKTLVKYYYGNVNGVGSVVNYFLRLPDGGSAGAGFAGTGLKSLKRLKDGAIPNITSVDGVNTYTWNDLVNTLKYIIFAEKGSDPQVWLNTASLSAVTNPNDHSDHFYSATAAQEAVTTFLWSGIHEFVMDYSSTLGANLNNEETENAVGVYGAYNWNLIKNRYPSQLNNTNIRTWLAVESFSEKRSPSGTAPVLPITLLSFNGTLKGNNVLVDWSTSSEVNSKEFQLEKSNDGITYNRLSTVAAAGNSSIVKKYTYLDIEATDLNYYRLKMVDLDGTYKQSDVVIVKNPGLAQDISSVNNPFKDDIRIRFAKMPKGKITLRLVDISGRLISSSEVYNPSSSVIRFDYNKALSKGIYILQAENDGRRYNIKLMKN